MKSVLLILSVLIVGSVIADDPCEYDQGDGQPGCTTDIEMCQKKWRNNWDPTRYWECETRNQPGVSHLCPTSTQFFAPILDCVNKNNWQWTPMCDPPSQPDETQKKRLRLNDTPPPCSYDQGDGRPGCKTPLELCQRLWRNNWDPTKYWECQTQNVPAVSYNCDTSLMFYSSTLKCISKDDWTWTPVCDPPSKP